MLVSIVQRVLGQLIQMLPVTSGALAIQYTLVKISFLISLLADQENRYLNSQLNFVGDILHEPQGRARQILIKHICWNHTRPKLVTLTTGNYGQVSPNQHRFNWVDADNYRIHTNSSINRTSTILASIHMGNFWSAYLHISAQAKIGRNFLVVRPPEVHAEFEDKMLSRFRSAGLDVSIYRAGKGDAIQLVRKLRQGRTTLACLFDKGIDAGDTVPVKFFGRKAEFVKGPAELAIIGKANILPFVTYRQNDMDFIEMEAPLSYKLLPDESLQKGIQRLTQALVSQAEKWIKAHPDQWSYLMKFHQYVGPARMTSKVDG